MNEAIIVALITGICAIVSTVVSAKSTQDKVTSELHTQNEVQNTKIQHLTEEVRKHNDFARRIPEIEGNIKLLDEKLSVANHRISDLERKDA